MKMKYSYPALSVAKFDSDMIIASTPQTNGANIVADRMTAEMGDNSTVESFSLSEFKMGE